MEKSREIRPNNGSAEIIVGLLLFAFACLCEVGMIALFHDEGRDGMILITIFSIVIVGSAVVLGIVCIRGHFAARRQIGEALERYGEENILSEMENAVIRIYHEPLTHREIYFTKHFVVAPKCAIFAYEEIARVYKGRNVTGKVHSTLVGFRLLNGDKHLLCDYASDRDVQDIMEICYRQNPRIILG